MDTLGFLLALLAMLLFGLYMVPRKLCGLRDFGFLLSMCVGAVVTTQVAQLIAHGIALPAVPPHGALLAFSCGPIWSLGMLFYTLSVSQMGLTLATPIKNTTAVLGTLFGLVVFAEWRETNAALAVIGSILVVLCAVLLARTADEDCSAGVVGRLPAATRDLRGPAPAAPVPARACVTTLGIVYALLAALFFSAYTIPMKLAQQSGVDSYRLMGYMGWGTLLGSAVLFATFSRGRRYWVRAPLKDHALAALAGAIWALATIAMSESIVRVGLAVTWPVSNLNTIVTVAAGIVVFREVSVRRHWRTILVSLACAVVGSLLLGVARR